MAKKLENMTQDEGIRAVSAYDLQELSEAMHTLQFQFNLKGE